jgi:hypothetical protein
MELIPECAVERNKSILIRLPRPRIERDRAGAGFYVIDGNHGWLCGDRRQALSAFEDLVDIERGRS